LLAQMLRSNRQLRRLVVQGEESDKLWQIPDALHANRLHQVRALRLRAAAR
jgi:hypothetical protein